jgi:hypothetical protein
MGVKFSMQLRDHRELRIHDNSTKRIKETYSKTFSPQENYSDRGLPLKAKLILTFTGRGYYVVRVTETYDR